MNALGNICLATGLGMVFAMCLAGIALSVEPIAPLALSLSVGATLFTFGAAIALWPAGQ